MKPSKRPSKSLHLLERLGMSRQSKAKLDLSLVQSKMCSVLNVRLDNQILNGLWSWSVNYTWHELLAPAQDLRWPYT